MIPTKTLERFEPSPHIKDTQYFLYLRTWQQRALVGSSGSQAFVTPTLRRASHLHHRLCCGTTPVRFPQLETP